MKQYAVLHLHLLAGTKKKQYTNVIRIFGDHAET